MPNSGHLEFLKQGVQVWNDWRSGNPETIPDLSNADLKGINLKSANLAKANLSYADIRGTNFSEANLRAANFTGAFSGSQRRWAALKLLALLVISLTFNISAIQSVNTFLMHFFSPEVIQRITFIPGSSVLLVVFLSIIFQGLTVTSLGIIAFAVFFASIISASGTDPISFRDAASQYSAAANLLVITSSFAFSLIASVAVNGACALLGIISIFNLTFYPSFSRSTKSNSEFDSSEFNSSINPLAAAFVYGIFIFMGLYQYAVLPGVISGSLTLEGFERLFNIVRSFALFNSYVVFQVLREDKKFTTIYSLGIRLAAFCGTSFRGADLTDATFSKASLSNTDFTDSQKHRTILTRVVWKDAVNTGYARVGRSILANPTVRTLLVKYQNQGKFLAGVDLRGASLIGIVLEKAELSGADMRDADLTSANLEGANLTRVLASGTNFCRAKLTGASGLGTWLIDSSTVLDDVDCTYVYLKTPEQGRYPDSRNLETGEFTKLFQEVKNTIEIIFRDGLDWKSFAYAFDETSMEIYSESGQRLSLRKYEVLDDGLIRLEVLVPPDIDMDKTRADLEFRYGHQVVRLEGQVELLQNINDKLLNEKLLNTLKPSVHFSGPVEEVNVGGSNTMSGDTYNNYGQSGAMGKDARSNNNMFIQSEQKQTLAEAAAEIQRLLRQLEQTNPNVTEAEKVAYVNDEITPGFKRRVVGALQAGGEAAIEEFLDNPYVNVGKAVVKGWIKPE